MNVDELLQNIKEHQHVSQLLKFLGESDQKKLHLAGSSTSFSSFMVAATYLSKKNDQLIIANDKETAAYVQNDLQSLLPKKDIFFLPDSFRKIGQYDELDNNNVRIRTEAIKHIVKPETKGTIIVTYPQALIEKVIDQSQWKHNALTIQIKKEIDIEESLEFLVELGFESTDFVYEPGQFSQRGGIVDIFSYGNEKPYRIELFGDEIESIRIFDPISQESEKKIEKVTIIPNIQGNYSDGKKVTLLTLLKPTTTVWFDDADLTFDFLSQTEKRFDDFRSAVTHIEEDHPLSEEIEFLANTDQLIKQFERFHQVHLAKKMSFKTDQEISISVEPQPVFNRNFSLLIQDLHQLSAKGYTLYIASQNPKQHNRFIQIFEDSEADILFHPLRLNIHKGFINHDLKLIVYTDHEIFERYHKYQVKKGYSKAEAVNMKTLLELQSGDFVTHIDHGVGKFSGLETLEVNGKKQEAVRLIYKNNDILYVGINALYKIAKYTGKEGKQPVLNKLGSDAWQKLKRKTKKKVKDIAQDLIRLYAKRRATKGFSFSPDTYLQLELESSFIYEDTPDQASATIQVKEDMEKPYPMDRLVCGDVGFGKTEIAMRAAFKAVADSKQVAILVPTTILALQHYKSFQKRFADFPVNIDYLNRFKTAKQKKETIAKLEAGEIDVIIGTHALAGKSVKFKDLGLLIIDEEQKFGVSIKEKLRQMKANVDTLTLTATPIPRTLQFSLMGARDLSIMRTPPPNRQPITTEIKPFNEEFLKEAITYEVYRGGQVFFVHNRVQSILEYAGILQRILPEIRIGIAHGQMPGDQLEKVLLEFIDQKSDVLLCTNIIEAGLDIPNANTMILNNAHQFGLSDLHQLRGRVGRSNKKAFCYLLAPPLSTLSVDSRKRLKTLEQFSDLGSGFQIAMRDLDIRGAGNILGAEQSGFISEIGMETFHKILDEAVSELKHTEFKEVFAQEIKEGKIKHVSDCQIDTDIEMRIPTEYVNSRSERMLLYQELNRLTTEKEINDYGHRLKDRFGPIPDSVFELFDAMRLQWVAKTIGIERIIFKNQIMKCYFIQKPDSPFYESEMFGRILAYIQKYPAKIQLKQSQKNLSLLFKSVTSMKNATHLLRQITTFEEVEATA